MGGPEWLTKGGAAFNGEQPVFYGVGNAAGIQNPALRRRSAEATARRFLAENFQVYVAGLNKQYLAETTAGDMERASVEQHVEDVMKQVTDATLVGTQIIEYWEHPDHNESYALVRLDLEEFLEAMQKYGATTEQFKELDTTMREFIRKNARKAHEELNKELEKQ
ncbi:MAG: LPP20 family lipoprotein [Nitrospira sp.]|nr:LPP20 family lipoprotein [Nitrospira sp.]